MILADWIQRSADFTRMRFQVLLQILTLLVCLPTLIRSKCDEDFGDLWQPSWANEPRNDLRCRLDEHCKNEPASIVESEKYDTCCKCRSCAVWQGSEIDLFIEFVSVFGRSLVVSNQAPEESEVYKVEHTDAEMTEIPSNLCDWESTYLEERYPDEFTNIQGFMKNIVKLNFENNKIHTLSDLNCLVRLDKLTLRNNKLTHVSNTSFTNLTSLRSIDFSGNQIKQIDPNILSSPHVQSLFYADFSYNEMTEIDVSNMFSYYPFCSFDYGSNQISELVNEADFILNTTITYGPGFVSFPDNQFSTWPDFEVLLNLEDITALGHLLSFGFDFRNIPLVCDCNIEEFMSMAYDVIDVLWRNYMDITCTAPKELAGTLVFDVDPVKFICPVENGCDPRCTCIDQPNKDTLFMDCSNSDLKVLPEIPYSRYSNYISLNVSGNEITRIQDQSYLSRISVLDISNNNLLEINENATYLLENASYIDISNNLNLRELSQRFQYHNVCSRHMRNLHISCDCESLWIEKWLRSKQCETHHNLFQCDIPKIGLKPALSFAKDNLECFPDHFPYLLEAITAATILLLILIGTLTYVFRYELLILFLRARQKQRNTVLPLNKYDVFLSFNDTDDDVSKWVNSILEPKLIKTGYRVFLPCRDVAFGAERDSEIISILAKTRNFLVVLSDSYLNEADDGMRSWTENEWKYGWNNFRRDRSKNIVLINFDYVSSFDINHPQIKAFIRVGCTVDFNNQHRNIMEDIYKKLGKPFKMPVLDGKVFENKNMKFSSDLFKVGFNQDKALKCGKEKICRQTGKDSDGNEWEQEHANILTKFKNQNILHNSNHDDSNRTVISRASETTPLKGQGPFRRCQYRKCYACCNENNVLKKIPNDKILENSSHTQHLYNFFPKETVKKKAAYGVKHKSKTTLEENHQPQYIPAGNHDDNKTAQDNLYHHGIHQKKQKTNSYSQNKHEIHNTFEENQTTPEDEHNKIPNKLEENHTTPEDKRDQIHNTLEDKHKYQNILDSHHDDHPTGEEKHDGYITHDCNHQVHNSSEDKHESYNKPEDNLDNLTASDMHKFPGCLSDNPSENFPRKTNKHAELCKHIPASDTGFTERIPSTDNLTPDMNNDIPVIKNTANIVNFEDCGKNLVQENISETISIASSQTSVRLETVSVTDISI